MLSSLQHCNHLYSEKNYSSFMILQDNWASWTVPAHPFLNLSSFRYLFFFHHYATSLFSSCAHKSFAASKCLPLCCQSYKSQRDTSKLPVNSIYIESIYLMSVYESYIENRQHDLSLTCYVFLLILLHPLSLYPQIIYCLKLSLARTLQTSVTCITTICHHRAVVYP